MKQKTLLPNLSRTLKVCLSMLMFLTLLLFSSCGVQKVVTEFGREKLSLSVLAVNLQNVETNYGNTTVPWQDRYGRIADWMGSTKTFPDFIALQEVQGESGSVKEYETLFTLITAIKKQTSISYRIAYMTLSPIPTGLRTTWQGEALLYNADRLTNLTANNNLPVMDFNSSQTGLHSRKSLQCQSPPPAFKDLCSLIDGDGIGLISSLYSHLYSSINPDGGRWVAGPVLARFELKEAQGSPIHIYNIHEPLSDTTKMEYLTQFQELISGVENKVGSNRLYPPIALGDFNKNVRDVLSQYPGFEIAGYANREVMGALVGKQDAFPSKQTAYSKAMIVPNDERGASSACGDPSQLWSDHCAVFVQFSPVPGTAPVLPTGPTAQGNVIHSGEVLHSGESISSTNGKYTLVLTDDSNLLLIRNLDKAELWKSDSHGRPVGVCRLNEGGKLVIYEKDGNQMWASGISPDLWTDSELVVQDDGNVVTYRPGGIVVWSTNTVQY